MKRALMLLSRETPNDFYDVTCALALIIPVMPAEERQVLAAEAVQTLKQAVDAGWTDAQRTNRDNDLASLRHREDFRRLVATLFDSSFPADPFAR